VEQGAERTLRASLVHSDFFPDIPLSRFKIILIALTGMTGEKPEWPKSQNDRNAGKTEELERQGSRNDRNDCCANILTERNILPGLAIRIEFPLFVIEKVNFTGFFFVCPALLKYAEVIP
jgi:hypothetical protein